MCSIEYAIVNTVSPKARLTPAKLMPSCGKAAASTALPQPPKTSQKVPIISANPRRTIGMSIPPDGPVGEYGA